MLSKTILIGVFIGIVHSCVMRDSQAPGLGEEDSQTAMSGVVNTCVFCDAYCSYKIAQIGTFRNSREYIDTVLYDLTKLFTNSGINVKFITHQVLGSTERVKIDNYKPAGTTGKEQTEGANKAFWTRKDYQSLKDGGCELGVFLATGNLWNAAGTVGAASFAALCTKWSYISINMNDASTDTVTAIMAHEVGHVMGMGHDLQNPRSEYSQAPYNQYSQGILAECHDDSDGCADGNGQCLMRSSVGFAPYPTKYSLCSKGYLDFWWTSNDYDTSCLMSTDLQSAAYLDSATYNYEEGGSDGSGE